MPEEMRIVSGLPAERSNAERLMALFAGHPDVHGYHGEPELDSNGIKWGIKLSARTVRSPVTLELWEKHLSGEQPLGIVPIRPDSTCLWGSIDYDQYDEDLLEIIAAVEQADLPLVPCRSKSGGLHLFLFLEDPQSAGAVQTVLREMAAQVGAAGSEIFPKQTQVLTERGDLGNWMVMPYFGGDYGGKLRAQVGMTRTGAEHTIERFLDIAEATRLNTEQFRALVERRRSAPRARKKRTKKTNGTTTDMDIWPFSDGPPCLEYLAEAGFSQGGRNNSLFMIGLYLKRKVPESWQRDLESANHQLLTPPLTIDEVTQVVRQLERKDYEYTCKTEPMCSHCDSITCRTRKFGVNTGGEWPELSNISKMTSAPPRWFVTVANVRIECSTSELYNYGAFNQKCMEYIDKCFQPMKAPNWNSLLNEALESVQLIEPPPEFEKGGMMREYLHEYLTARSRAPRKEDLNTGRPWEEEETGLFYFRFKDFLEWLHRKAALVGVKDNELLSMFEALGGFRKKLNFDNKRSLHTWVIHGERIGYTRVIEEKQEEPHI